MLEYFPNVKFYKTFHSVEDIVKSNLTLQEIAVCGRSNSGKSTLINVLCNQKKLAFVSSIPGKTKTINYYYVPSYKTFYKEFFLVDLPGYGYAEVSKKQRKNLIFLVDQYLERSKNLKLLILIIDAIRDLEEEEISIINYFQDFRKNLIIVKSKWDRINQREKNQILEKWRKNKEIYEKTLFISSFKKNNISLLIKKIIYFLSN